MRKPITLCMIIVLNLMLYDPFVFAAIDDYAVSIDNASGIPGAAVTVAVRITQAGSDICGGAEFNILFDPNALQVNSVQAGSLRSWGMFQHTILNGNTVRILTVGIQEPLNTTGEIALIHFSIKPTASIGASGLTFSRAVLNLNSTDFNFPPANITNGSFTVIQLPVAGFTASSASVYIGETVQFSDQSTGAITSYSWDFGDGHTSIEENPSHKYTTAGSYIVSLTVTGPGGSDTESKSDYIHVTLPVPLITSIAPDEGRVGGWVRISGENFGFYGEWCYVAFHNSMRPAEIEYWDDTVICCVVPRGAETGPVVVMTDWGTSNSVEFTVIRVPIIYVGGYEPDYYAIQEAIDNAQPGDTIYVYPDEYGNYAEDIILKDNISIIGIDKDATIVSGKVTMADNSSIENMSFEYNIPDANPSVILNIASSDVTVKDCVFRLYQNQPRYGIQSLRSDYLAKISGDNITLEGNDFYFESSSSRFIQGVYVNQSKNLVMRGNRIHIKGDTTRILYYLSGVNLVNANSPTFENNIINLESNNAWTLSGLTLSACDNALVKNNTVLLKNTRPYINQFTGISIYQVPHINIRNNIINFEGNLQNPYYTYYPYVAYLKPCNITGDKLTGDIFISLTYNIYNAGSAFLSKTPATLAVTEHNNIKGEGDSIAIDRGDPLDDYSKEPEPNGGRINCGAYGNTSEAAMTPAYIATHVIFAEAETGGTITPRGSILVNDGNDQAFTMTPSYYYSILDVLLDGVSEPVTGNTYTLDNVTADHTIKARFTPKPTITITAQAGNGGYISPSGSVKVVIGDSRAFYITPYTDQHIKDIMVDGASIGPKASYTFTDVNTNHTIQAVFEEGRAIIAMAREGGEIDPEGEIRIEPDEYGKYERYTFRISPYEGYRIKEVLVDGAPIGSVTSYEFTDLSRSHIIEAVFAKKVYELSVDTEGGGSVSITPEKQEYEYGTYVSLRAVPSEGHYFSRWTGDTKNISGIYNPSTYIIMRDNASIVALFASYGNDAD